MIRSRVGLARSAAAILAVAWGCTAEQTSTGPLEAPLLNLTPGNGAVEVCKFGPAGTQASFTVSAAGGVLPYGASFTLQAVPFDGGSCTDAVNRLVVWLPGTTTTNTSVTVTEVSATPGIFLDRINVFADLGNQELSWPVTSATVTVGPDARALILFKNAGTPVDEGQGCTPGYWKQSQHFDSWPAAYVPTQSVGSVFAQSSLYIKKGGGALNTYNLVTGLSFQGGSTTSGGAEILLRAAIAAVLNSATNLDYPVATAAIISDVNAALASGNRATMIALAAQLDAYNNLGCPLN